MDSRVIDRSGFTLIELLVALVISGIVVGSIFQMIMGQGRFVEMQSAREEVQQNTRAALELISSELRTIPGGEALVAAADDSITMRVVRAWGVVCAAAGSSIDVVVPTIGGLSYGTNLGTGVVVNLGTALAPDWSNAVRVNSIGNASNTCAGDDVWGGTERRTMSLVSQPQNSAGTRTPQAGDVVYLYEQVTYRTGTSAGVPGLWILRRIGEGVGASNQPFSGPVEEGGLRFQYFQAGSSTPLTTPLSAANRPSVARVAVVVESVSRNSQGEARESKADTAVVALRNRM